MIRVLMGLTPAQQMFALECLEQSSGGNWSFHYSGERLYRIKSDVSEADEKTLFHLWKTKGRRRYVYLKDSPLKGRYRRRKRHRTPRKGWAHRPR